MIDLVPPLARLAALMGPPELELLELELDELEELLELELDELEELLELELLLQRPELELELDELELELELDELLEPPWPEPPAQAARFITGVATAAAQKNFTNLRREASVVGWLVSSTGVTSVLSSFIAVTVLRWRVIMWDDLDQM